MRCSYHPNNEAAGTCVTCGRLICNECMNQYEGRILCNYCIKVLKLTAQIKETRKKYGGYCIGLLMIMFVSIIVAVVQEGESRATAILVLVLAVGVPIIAALFSITFALRSRRIQKELQLRIDKLRSQQSSVR